MTTSRQVGRQLGRTLPLLVALLVALLALGGVLGAILSGPGPEPAPVDAQPDPAPHEPLPATATDLVGDADPEVRTHGSQPDTAAAPAPEVLDADAVQRLHGRLAEVHAGSSKAQLLARYREVNATIPQEVVALAHQRKLDAGAFVVVGQLTDRGALAMADQRPHLDRTHHLAAGDRVARTTVELEDLPGHGRAVLEAVWLMDRIRRMP